MNLVGKIFVVLIFVMSLVFMAFAISVYTVQQNWRDVVVRERAEPGRPLGLKYQLQEQEKRIKELSDRREQAERDRETEKVNKLQALTKLQTENEELLKARRDLESTIAQEKKDTREAVSAMNATQKSSDSYRKELETVRKDALEAGQDRDAHFKEVEAKTDEMHQLKNELEQLRLRNEDLSNDLAKAREALRYFDIDEKSDYKSKTPPRVDGLVTATPGQGLVEISIGSDDGLRKGHRLEVYRISGGTSVYVGRIEVVETSPSKAVCKIDPSFQKSRVMEGDRVDSKIE